MVAVHYNAGFYSFKHISKNILKHIHDMEFIVSWMQFFSSYIVACLTSHLLYSENTLEWYRLFVL